MTESGLFQHDIREYMEELWAGKVTDAHMTIVNEHARNHPIEKIMKAIKDVAGKHEINNVPIAKIRKALCNLPRPKAVQIEVRALRDDGKHLSCWFETDSQDEARAWMRNYIEKHWYMLKRHKKQTKEEFNIEDFDLYVGEENRQTFLEEMLKLSTARSVEIALKAKMDKRDRDAMHIGHIQGQIATFKPKERKKLTESELEAELTAENLF